VSLHQQPQLHRSGWRQFAVLVFVGSSVDGILLSPRIQGFNRASIAFLSLNMAHGGASLLGSGALFRRFAAAYRINLLMINRAAAPLANPMLQDEGAHLVTV
jgi:hypothetical protein